VAQLGAALQRWLLGLSADEIRYTFDDVRNELRATRAELREELQALRRDVERLTRAQRHEGEDDDEPMAQA
jgi:hypothetical protein